MVTLHGWGYALAIGIVAALGAVGGVAAELLQPRAGDTTCAIQLPKRDSAAGVVNLGVVGSVLLGAIAGVAVLYFFPPTTTSAPSGSQSYDIVKGVALSLIAGSAGRSLLTGLQARLLASEKVQQARLTADVASNQIQRQAETAAPAAAEVVRAVLTEQGVSTQQADLAATQAKEVVDKDAKQQAGNAKALIAQVAPPPRSTPAGDSTR